MNSRNLLRSAWSGITSNLLRTALTMLGVIIGTASVIVMLALGNGARAAVEASFRSLGSDTIRIDAVMEMGDGELVPSGKILSYSDGLALSEAVPDIDSVSMQLQVFVKARRQRHTAEIMATGTTPNALDDIPGSGEVQPANWQEGLLPAAQDFILEGRFFNDIEVDEQAAVCVLGYDTWLELFQSDYAIGETIVVNRMRCTVIGVLAELEMVDAKKRHESQVNDGLYMPISTVIESFYEDEPSLSLVARVCDEDLMTETKEQVADLLRSRHDVELDEEGEYDDDFYLTTRQDVLGAQQESARTLSLLLASMAVVSLVVGGIGIMNVMLVSVSERTREIGIRMAVGAEDVHIILQFLLESILISAGGGLMGIAAGILTIPLAASLNQGVALLAPYSILLSFFVALCVGVLFGLYPALRAARLDPIEALHHE